MHIAVESVWDGDCENIVPMQTAYLSLMCYNFGIDTYDMRKFEDSAFWLR